MTEPERILNSTPEQRREAWQRPRWQGQQRANYRNAGEDRQFRVGALSTAPSVRVCGACRNSTVATDQRSAHRVRPALHGFDRFGSFTEAVQAGALTPILLMSEHAVPGTTMTAWCSL